MARAHIPFYTMFTAMVRETGLLPKLETDADLKAKMLQIFNRTYKTGYALPTGTFWEDARTWAEITPVDGLITYDVLGDAREFKMWDVDPREDARARELAFATDLRGITVSTDFTTVWMSWMPEVVKFSTTAWATATAYVVGDVRVVTASGECYRCLVAHTSVTFATDLTASKWLLLPVLDVLEEFIITYGHGAYLKGHGQPETGYKMMGGAQSALLETHRAELRRNLPRE